MPYTRAMSLRRFCCGGSPLGPENRRSLCGRDRPGAGFSHFRMDVPAPPGRPYAAERDGVDYNLACIGRDFAVEYDKPFQQSYMRPVFEYGRQRALRGDAWVRRPPI